MKIVLVEYTVTLTGEDGKSVSVNKERILTELDSIDPKYIQHVLEQEVQDSEQLELGSKTAGSLFGVRNISELYPTGDAHQM